MAISWQYGYVSYEELMDWVRAHPLNPGNSEKERIVPVCVWGARGLGKTAQIRSYCEKREIGFRGFQPALNQQGADLIGIPYLDEETHEMKYALPKWLPQPDDPDVLSGKGGVIFIDEINRAPQEVLQGFFEPLGEGEISLAGWKLPPGWGFVCAANPNEVGYQVNPLDMALLNRMINYAPGWNTAVWVNWATKAGSVPEKIIDFALQAPNKMEIGEARLPADVVPAATPRSLEYMGALYEPGMELRMLHTVGHGLLGEIATDALMDIHRDDAEPLRGREILSGKVNMDKRSSLEWLSDWKSGQRWGLIRASTELAISELYGKKAQTSKAALHMHDWIMNIPESMVGETVASMQESIPDWLELFKHLREGTFEKRIPPPSLIQKASKVRLDMEMEERQQRDEMSQWKKDTGPKDTGPIDGGTFDDFFKA